MPEGADANALLRGERKPKQVLDDLLASAVEQVPERAVPPETKTKVATESEPSAREDEVVLVQGDRRYRIRGLAKNLSRNVLKVNLLVSRGDGECFHVDTLDLYLARQRNAYVKQAAVELGVEEEILKREVGRVLLKAEEWQEEAIRQALAPPPPPYTMTEEEEAAALRMLKDPDLMKRIERDFQVCGLVGELDNKLAGYLAAVSRKLDDPLALLVQSSSAAGKTSLLDAVLAFVPPEDRMQLSAMTGQSLYYLPPDALTHKVLALAEQEGGSKASYALKLLQSEGALSIATTAKESGTGRLRTEQYEVKGPVAIFTSTTAAELDPELVNRCIVLVTDESAEQTRAIHEAQKLRQTVEGLVRQREKERLVALHWNVQRLLRPVRVLNPFARQLTFPDTRTRLRRDFTKYLGLIQAVTLLFQHQRPRRTHAVGGEAVEYIESTAEDIQVANRLAHRVLGRALDDLPPQTRKLLARIDELVKGNGVARLDHRFTQRQLREATGWGATQTKVHLGRLVAMELVVPHRGKERLTEYQLLFDGNPESQEPHLPGLIDLRRLNQYEERRSEAAQERSGVERAEVGPGSAECRGPESDGKAKGDEGIARGEATGEENEHQEAARGRGVPATGEGIEGAVLAVAEGVA